MNGKRQVVQTSRQFYRAPHQNEIFMKMYGTGRHMLKAVSHNHKTSTTYCLLYDEPMLKIERGGYGALWGMIKGGEERG